MADLLYVMGFLDPPAVGAHEFSPENLHVTFLNAVSISDNQLPNFVHKLKALATWFAPLPLTPGQELLLGDKKDIPAVGIEKTPELTSLHLSMVSALRELGGRLPVGQYHEELWLPHITNWVSPEPVVLSSYSIIWHKNGFGVNVTNLANISLE